MTRARRTLALALAIGVAAMLSGCVDPSTAADPSVSPSVSRVFASEEEALKAATDAYAAYTDVAAQVAQDGGANPERLSTVASGSAYEKNLATFRSFSERGVRGVGSQTFDTFSVQSFDASGDVSAYLCLDTSNTDVVDKNGASTVPASRTTRFPLVVKFERPKKSESENALILTESESWSNTNFC